MNEEPAHYRVEPINLLHHRPLPPLPDRPDSNHRSHWRWYFFLIVFIIVVGGCAYRNFTLSEVPTDAAIYDPVTLKPKKINWLYTVKNYLFHSGNVLAGEGDDRVNILLLGMGGVGHDGPFLTDTNIIVSVRPDHHDAAMISVPRDLGVSIDGYGVARINSANAYGEAKQSGQGGEFARQVFEKTFNLPIPYYIRVDFKAFTDLIDAVGGVTIDVPRAFMDEQFPGPNNSYQTIVFAAGPELMNGDRALKYARSRHGTAGEGSDFARARRQQQVLTALKEKVLSFGTYTNPITLQKIIESLSNHISTNLNFGQMMYLASLARPLSNSIKTLVLDNGNNGYLVSGINANGAFMLSPKSGNFDDINAAIENVFDTSTVATKPLIADADNKPIFPTAKIEMQNGTWQVGLASRWQQKLEDKGFTVTEIGNSKYRPVTKTTIYLINKQAPREAVDALAKELKAPFATELPDWLIDSYDNPATPDSEVGQKFDPQTDILIILGEDANV